MSICGLITSIAGLLITLCAYLTFTELLNLPGKNLVCLMLSLIFAQTLFLCSNQAVSNAIACKVMAICVHYFFLSSFSWMNVIAFDLFTTFSHSFAPTRAASNSSKRFYSYSSYGWLVPFTITTIAVVLDLSYAEVNGFRPGYGEGICWITSRNALLLFFVGPLAVFKLFDVVGFLCTWFHISRTKQQGLKARKQNDSSCWLYFKLCMVMGLTWLFAFVAILMNNTVMWYLFIVFNTLQGVVIALSFLCTRKVKRLINRQFRERRKADTSRTRNTDTTSGTGNLETTFGMRNDNAACRALLTSRTYPNE